MISEVLLIPELHVGVTVLSNRDGGGAVRAIIDQLSDYFLNVKGIDIIAYWKAKVDARSHSDDSIHRSIIKETLYSTVSVSDIKKLAGTYKDSWFGNVTISALHDKLYFRSVKSLMLHGQIFSYKPNIYLVKWANRGLHADALLIFNPNERTFTMAKALSETTSAFDFEDLDFKNIN